MAAVASRELRNQTRSILDRVAAGEHVTITVDGRPVAVLSPLGPQVRWMPRQTFLAVVAGHQADPRLREDLRGLVPDTTDDLRW